MNKVLCDYKLKNASVYVEASINGGKLLISGQDLGSLVEELFHDSDYEYFYSFDEENTRKLLGSLKSGAEIDELLNLLADKFSGVDGCRLLRCHCEEKKIQYKFNSF